MSAGNDLSKLVHDEICEVRMKDSAEFREARCRPVSKLFFTDGYRPMYYTLKYVLERWPASVKF